MIESIKNKEQPPIEAFEKPAIESLTNPKLAAEIWPTSISQNPEFLKQVQEQSAAIESYKQLVQAVPVGKNVMDSFADGEISEIALAETFTRIAQYMDKEPGYGRLALYMPFELIPSKDSNVESPLVAKAAQSFSESYRRAWESQLTAYDVRANFVDGNILEPELRTEDHPRVVKATHLIPGLVEHGHMSFQEAVQYAEKSDDILVKQGIIDSFKVMLDMGNISEAEIDLLRDSRDIHLNGSYHELTAQTFETDSNESMDPVKTIELLEILSTKIHEIDQREDAGTTVARDAWLKKQAFEKAILEAASTVSQNLLNGSSLPDAASLDVDSLVACVEALTIATSDNPDLFEQNKDWVTSATELSKTAETYDALSKLYSHLHSQGIVSKQVLDQAGINVPNLNGDFSKNLESIAPFLAEVESMSEQIKNDPYLGQHVYPATLVFGSQLKGYGRSEADADVAVFIKPGTPREEKERLEESLKNVFSHEKIDGKAVQFWLDQNENGLSVHDWENPTISDGSSSWAHVLLGSAWKGDRESIKTLYHDLLPNYLQSPEAELDGKPTKDRWLEEIERDAVQYRLLHKGFERYYPIKSPMDTKHGDAIDGHAAFYDPQYRRLASEIFLKRVFLPNV